MRLMRYTLVVATFLAFAILSSVANAAHGAVITSGVYVGLGNHFFKQGNFGLAAKLFEKAVAVSGGNNAAAHHNLGIVYYEEGNSGKAEEEFRNAIEANQDYAKAYNSLAILLFGKGRFSEAAAYFRKVVELSPENAQAHFDLGASIGNDVRYGNGTVASLGDALGHFREAERLQPGYAYARQNIKVIEEILGSYYELKESD